MKQSSPIESDSLFVTSVSNQDKEVNSALFAIKVTGRSF